MPSPFDMMQQIAATAPQSPPSVTAQGMPDMVLTMPVAAPVYQKQILPRESKIHRTVGDVTIMSEAQRIYNPAKPPAAPSAPKNDMVNTGTTSALGPGRWGGAQK